MAALNFPTGAINGTTYTDDFGRTWTYNGTYWSIDSSSTIGIANETTTGLLSHLTQSIGGAKTFVNNTNSTSSTTGALIVVGGLGVSGDINGGTGLSITGAVRIGSGLSVQSTSTLIGAVSILSNANSTSSTTGALIITGGIGLSGRLSSGTGISVLSMTDSSSPSTGAITVLGGIGSSANIYSRGLGLTQNAAVSAYASLIKASALAQSANYNYYLPQNAPTQGQFLQASTVSGTDYTLSWVSPISKSVTILSPQATDKVTLFALPYAATLTKMQAVIRGSSTPSVNYNVKYGTDRTSGTLVVSIGSTVSSTTTGDVVTSFNNSSPAADSYVWLEMIAVSGTVDEFHLTVYYR